MSVYWEETRGRQDQEHSQEAIAEIFGSLDVLHGRR